MGLVIGALLSAAAVATALVLQHFFDMMPCAWCVMQRFLYLLIVVWAIVGWPLRNVPAAWRAINGLAVVTAIAGMAAGIYQWGWASKTSSCALTFADRVMTKLGLDQALPSVFAATAPCDEASAPLLGVPFPLWAVALFGLIAVIVLPSVLGRDRR